MYRRPRHRTVLPGSNLSEAAIGVAIRSCPGVQPRRSYSRLHAIIADSASFANSADRSANNFASDNCDGWLSLFNPERRVKEDRREADAQPSQKENYHVGLTPWRIFDRF